MSNIRIEIADIETMDTDCIVNAANDGLQYGTGVCGAIFDAAGVGKMQKACDEIGGCPTGHAVITPGFKLNAKYVVHAVGPRWKGTDEDRELLAACYKDSLDRAKENDCRSIAFPLISSGVFGCPQDEAWKQAVKGCAEWIEENPDYDMDIVFAVRKESVKGTGEEALKGFKEE